MYTIRFKDRSMVEAPHAKLEIPILDTRKVVLIIVGVGATIEHIIRNQPIPFPLILAYAAFIPACHYHPTTSRQEH